jgi:hypothetical protein
MLAKQFADKKKASFRVVIPFAYAKQQLRLKTEAVLVN